jgi:Skp family chaperone for outer membrane proteins
MSRNRLVIAFTFLLLAGATVFGQQAGGQPSPRPASQRPAAPQTTAPQTSAPIPEGRLALIYSEEFRDPKSGIARYNVLMTSLNNEFQPRQKELNDLAQRIQQLNDDIEKTRSIAAPDAIVKKIEQLDQMKKDYQRKGEDAQSAFKRRHEEVMNPLNAEIGKALETYAKARNITVIIDGNQVPLVYAVESIDITRQFINDFNSKNPATAAATPRP